MSGPGVKELLHFSMVLMSSSFEKEAYSVTSLLGISYSRLILIWQFWAELKDLCSASQRSLSSIQGWSLYWIAFIARSFLFLIQFISSHELQFLLAISSIFSSKLYLVLLTILLNLFQSSNCLDCLYISRSLQQL